MVRKTCLMLAKNPNLQVLNVWLATSKRSSSHHLWVDTRLILEPFAMLRGISSATFRNIKLVDNPASATSGPERYMTVSKFSLDFSRLQGILSAIRTEPGTSYSPPYDWTESWHDPNKVSSGEYTWTTGIVSPDYAKHLKDKAEGDSPVNSLPEDFEALVTRTKDFLRLPRYHNKDRMIQAFIAMEEEDTNRYFQLKEQILEDFQEYLDAR